MTLNSLTDIGRLIEHRLEDIKSPFAEIYENTSQTPATTDPVPIALNEEGNLHKLIHVAADSAITVQEPGVYLLLLDTQVGRTAGGSTDWVDIWLVKNGENLPNTRARRIIRDPNGNDEMSVHAVVRLEKDDTVEAMMQVSATGAGLGLKFNAGDATKPNMPSVNFVIWRVTP